MIFMAQKKPVLSREELDYPEKPSLPNSLAHAVAMESSCSSIEDRSVNQSHTHTRTHQSSASYQCTCHD